MIMLAFLIAAPSPALVQKADEANEAHVACQFATSRAAYSERLPVAEFKRRLAIDCAAEERAAREAMIRVLSARGEPEPAAAVDQLLKEGRDGMIAGYESMPETESQLRKIAEICRQRPEECR